MFCDDGVVIFYYKSSPNWVRPGSTYYEFMVVYDDENECHTIKEYKKPIDRELDVFEIDEKDKIGCTFEKTLTLEEFKKISEIIEKHKDLINVSTELYNDVCDGSHEDFYFQGRTFNRSCGGNVILSTGSWYIKNNSEDIDFFESEFENDRQKRRIENARQSSIVYRAVNEIFDYLKSINKFPAQDDQN